MKRGVLINKKGFGKDVLIVTNPRGFRSVLNENCLRIIKHLSKKEAYPAKIAKEQAINIQKVYYYIAILKKAGLVKLVKEEEIKGARAKWYKLITPVIALELSSSKGTKQKYVMMDEKLRDFFKPAIHDGKLDATFVVGSPEPHGPYKASARDGHYAIQLGLMVGQFLTGIDRFAVKLDVDVKSEGVERGNMILIGGPGVNTIVADINRKLPIKFDERNYWAGIVSSTNVYTADSCGIVAKIRNPFNKQRTIHVFAGLRALGTKAAIMAITKDYDRVLRDYRGEDEWACVVRGYDLDADGKIDSIEVLETS